MTREETAQILRIVKSEWRHDFKDMTRDEMADRLNLWAEMFKDENAGLVGAAVKAIIVAGEREHAPNVGTIKEQMRKLTTRDEMDGEEAWHLIRRAVSNGLYGSKEEFAKLPPLCQKLVGSPPQLRDWAMIDSDELETVVGSHVRKAYRIMQQREAEAAKLPNEVKALIAGYSERLALEREK